MIGGTGLIGRSLANYFSTHNYSLTISSRQNRENHPFIDLSYSVKSYDLPQNISHAFICAARTSIEECRLNPKEAHIINVQQTEVLAKQLVCQGSRVIFLSSDAVYDGSKPYREPSEDYSPITEYGKQKAEIEKRLLKLSDKITIVRLTKVLSCQSLLIAEWIKDLKNNINIYPYNNMMLSPVSLSFVTDVLANCINTECSGIIQVSGSADISYAKLAKQLAASMNIPMNLIHPVERQVNGRLPLYSSLDTSRLQEVFGMSPPSLEDTIQAINKEFFFKLSS